MSSTVVRTIGPLEALQDVLARERQERAMNREIYAWAAQMCAEKRSLPMPERDEPATDKVRSVVTTPPPTVFLKEERYISLLPDCFFYIEESDPVRAIEWVIAEYLYRFGFLPTHIAVHPDRHKAYYQKQGVLFYRRKNTLGYYEYIIIRAFPEMHPDGVQCIHRYKHNQMQRIPASRLRK